VKNEKLTYSAVNQKSAYIYFWLLIMLGISGFATWFGYILIKDGLIIYSLITLPFVLLFPLVSLHFLNSKIVLTTDSVIRKTLFGSKQFKYKDIKTLKRFDTMGGGYGMTSFIETEEEQSNSKDILSIKQIYLSEKEDSSPNKFGRDKRLLFNETGDIYERIKEKITAVNIR
jgi:hypothetical protein